MASVNAVPMSAIAVVSVEGVGELYDAAKSFPTTWLDDENVPSEATVKEKPVRAVPSIGLTAMSPAGWKLEVRIREREG